MEEAAKMIYYITPHSPTKHYGTYLNLHIQPLPEDAWICVRDLDTLVFDDDITQILEQAINDNPDVDLFTCASNRAYGQRMLTESDMMWHWKQSRNREKRYVPITGVVPAFFWLFPKRIWRERPFDNLPIISQNKSFDARWTRKVPWKKMRIDHLYVFHWYRMQKPRNDWSHLK